MRAPSSVRRFIVASGYLLLAVAGVCAYLWPAPSIARALDGGGNPQAYLILAWDAFLVVGGLASAGGVIADRWFGEYIGLPLLASVFAVYGVAAGGSGLPTSRAGAATLIAVALLIIARWFELGLVRKAAEMGAAVRRSEDHEDGRD